MKNFNFLALLFTFFSNLFLKFKDSKGANLSQTTKGGIKKRHLDFLKPTPEIDRHKYSRRLRIRYTGLNKYRKVPTIQV